MHDHQAVLSVGDSPGGCGDLSAVAVNAAAIEVETVALELRIALPVAIRIDERDGPVSRVVRERVPSMVNSSGRPQIDYC